MIHRLLSLAALTGMLAMPLAASAHETAKGPHGGPVVEAAGHHVEFVPSATEMTFFLSGNKDEPISPTGAKMKAIVQDSGKTTQVELKPAEPDKLSGTLASPLTKGAKVVLSGTLSDGHSLQARFVVP